MKNSRTLHAFTLPEITVAMVIAAVVITGAGSILNNLLGNYRNWQGFQSNYLSQELELGRIESEFRNSRAILPSDSGVTVISDSTIVRYFLGIPCIRYEGEHIDTLGLEVQRWEVHEHLDSEFVDTLKLWLPSNSGELPHYVCKHYSYHQFAQGRHGDFD